MTKILFLCPACNETGEPESMVIAPNKHTFQTVFSVLCCNCKVATRIERVV